MADFPLEVLPTGAVDRYAPTSYGVEFLTSTSSSWVNVGYYVTGAVWEEYTSTGGPSATPPSGHTLIGLSSWPVE